MIFYGFINRTILLILALFFVCGIGFAQKIIQKEFDAKTIQSLVIEDNALFKISIFSSEIDHIKMILHVSGEHSENIVIEEKRQNGALFLTTGFNPFFEKENDKLAAHKVMALQMEIFIPDNISISIKSKLASVITRGTFNNLAIVLENGSCVLNNFSGNARLKSLNGDISVFARGNVSGSAVSKSGTVDISLPPSQKYLVVAESVNGNISMEQTK